STHSTRSRNSRRGRSGSGPPGSSDMTDIATLTAAEQALRIRWRDFSPVELIEATIARIEKRNPSLNALIYLGFDDARREAKKAEDAVMKGGDLVPLHGVPSAIKDLFDFKPVWPTTFGGVR